MKKLLLVAAVVLAPLALADNHVDALVEQKLNEYFASEQFEQVIDQAIERYAQRQQAAQRQAQEQAVRERTQYLAPVSDDDYIRGNPDARFTLLEYSDFECPFCKRFHDTAKQLLERNDDVNWVYRHFPLDFHNPLAQKQAEAAECVGQIAGSDAYWAYADAVFARTSSNGDGMPIADLAPIAGELGLDEAQVQACMDSGEMRERVLSQYQNGQQAGVSGTPGNFLIDHKTGRVVPMNGAQPLSNLEDALTRMRAE